MKRIAVKNLFLLIIVSLLFSACLPKQDDVKSALQTNSATVIKKDYEELQKNLITLKKKLDKRNPKAFSKKYEKRVYRLLEEMNGTFLLKYNDTVLDRYKDYLQLAFSKSKLSNRNDYLILGIYYMIHYAYDLDDYHKLGAFEYDKDKLEKIYTNLKMIKWKIKHDRDLRGDYLYLTWQNNWQIELENLLKKKKNISYDDIKNLESVKNGKESIFDSSNFSFEVLLTQMIENVGNSIRAYGEEPKELTIKSLFLFL